MSSPSASLLLRNGTVLTHNDDDTITPLLHTDLLIENSFITAIGSNLSTPPSVRRIDCTGKIISPGFIDTHHHVWQTQLKGRFSNDTLFDYMPRGNMASYAFTPSDMYWGQLGGCLEAIDAGTTMVVDHAHGICSPEHATRSISASCTSGIRSIYCYAYTQRLSSWTQDECVPDRDILPNWATSQIESLASQPSLDAAQSSDRVHLGIGFDFYFLPREMVVSLFERFRALKSIKLITSHVSRNAVFGMSSTVSLLKEYGLLGRDILVSHANWLEEEDYRALKEAGCYISSTPDTEAQMGLGAVPIAFAFDAKNKNSKKCHGCLGVDCHVNQPSSIIAQARTGLLLARAAHNEPFLAEGKFPLSLPGDAAMAFNLATIEGARACGMEESIGSLRVGKKADVVVFDAAGSPGMVCAAEQDPVVAVLRFSEVRDVEMVIVDGVVRKENGKLVDVVCYNVDDAVVSAAAGGGSSVAEKREKNSGRTMSWAGIAKELQRSRAEIQKRLDGVSVDKGKEMMMQMWGINPENLVSI